MNHIGAITGGVIRVLMHFHKNGGNTDRNSGASQYGGKTPVAPDEVPCPPGCCTEWVASNTTGQPVWAMIGSARMSDTSVLYPKLAPRSQTVTFSLPVLSIFFTTFAISHGARNWPF